MSMWLIAVLLAAVALAGCLILLAVVLERRHKTSRGFEPGYPHTNASPEEVTRPGGVGQAE